MPLTLNNDLTGLVSREVNAASSEVATRGKSMVTGDNQNLPPVDGFLGNSLHDSEFFLSALAKTASYATNVINVTEEYFKSIASYMQDAAGTIATAASISSDKVAVLQKHINDLRAQIDTAINTAFFDGRYVLKGGASQLNVQVSSDSAASVTVRVRNISGNRLFLTTLGRRINEWLAQDFNRTTHYASQAELDAALLDNENLIAYSMQPGLGGAGNGPQITDANLAAGLIAIRAIDPQFFVDYITFAAPTFTAAVNAIGGGVTLANANVGNFTVVLGLGAGVNYQDLGFGVFAVQDLRLDTQRYRTISLDIFQSSLNSIRAEQARLSTQKTNLAEAVDALRATTNATEAAGNSYTKADYVLEAQQYSELIRQIVASVTSLQAANKIPEAAQRLIDSLAE
jgi:flagellin-like hook-associated protein FlgL